MVTVKDNEITMIRGDTAKIQISITNADGEPYEPQEGDSIRFAAKRKYTDTNCAVEKAIPTDTLLLQLDPEDTKGLMQGETKGRYFYDIELTQADGTVDTFIRGVLILLEEVE